MKGEFKAMKNRNIVLCVVFSLITCGIYGIYWIYQLVVAVPQITGVPATVQNPILETLLCCTPYQFYWQYKVGESLDAKGINGISAGNNKIIFLLLSIFGLGIVNFCILQNEINKVTA